MQRIEVASVANERWLRVRAAFVGPTRIDEPTRHVTRWVPLLDPTIRHRFDLGLTANGDWIQAREALGDDQVPYRGHIYAARFGSSCLYLVPMLEVAPSLIRHRAEEGARRVGLDPEAVWAGLPWFEAVRAGVRSGRERWVAPALDWALALDALPRLQAELAGISRAPDLPDGLLDRIHRARGLAWPRVEPAPERHLLRRRG